MDAHAFEDLAEKTLERLFNALDEAIGGDSDVDLEGGILTIELEDGRQYIINKHTASLEIWVSSPVSGAAHYAYQPDAETWISTRGGADFYETLSAELSLVSGETVQLG